MKTYKMLFIGNIFSHGIENGEGRTGIYFVALNILNEMLSRESECFVVLYLNKFAIKYKDAIIEQFEGRISDVRTENDDFRDISCCYTPFDSIPEEIKQCPYISCYYMIYDIIPELFPEYFPDNADRWFRELIKSFTPNDFIFTISNNTKKDLLSYHPTLCEKHIKCAYISTNKEYKTNNSKDTYDLLCIKYKALKNKKYVLSLASLEPRKNTIRAAIAFIKFVKKNSIDDIVFVLGGQKWNSFEELINKSISKSDIDKYLCFTGYVPDDDQEALYSNALWFVYTSEYEGFGMPPLEAMSCGCPVVASNSSSLPEVFGEAPLYTDFDDIDGHVQAYECYYYDEEMRRTHIKKGFDIVKQYSWKKCVDCIFDTVDEVEKRKKQTPLITIITPTYNLVKNNRVKSFQRMLESIDAQTYLNIEHIIIDGDSEDDTISILDEVKKANRKYVSEKDDGLYYAINKGIDLARGEFVAILNSDDYFSDSHAIEWLVKKTFEQDTRAVCGSARVVNQNGELILEKWGSFDTDLLIFGRMACHQTFLISTELMRQLGYYPTEYKISADTAFILRLLQNEVVISKMDKVIVTYALGGVSSNKEEVYSDVSKAIYNEYGRYHNLTKMDCRLLCAYKYRQLNGADQIVLGTRLSLLNRPIWTEEYFANINTENINFKKIIKFFKYWCMGKMGVCKKQSTIYGRNFFVFYFFDKIPFFIRKVS